MENFKKVRLRFVCSDKNKKMNNFQIEILRTEFLSLES